MRNSAPLFVVSANTDASRFVLAKVGYLKLAANGQSWKYLMHETSRNFLPFANLGVT